MTDKKISALTDLGGAPASTDVLPIVDSSANQTKKVSVEDLFTNPNVTGTLTSDGLTVDGDVSISDTSVILDLMETDTTDVNTRIQHSSGDLLIRTLNDAKSAVTTRLAVDHATGDISFYEDTGTTAKFFWDASAESLGIGTTSPSAPLSIGSVSGDTYAIFDNGTKARLTFNGDASAAKIFATTTGFANYEDLEFRADNYLFKTGTTEVMRLDSSGNLLVGKSANNFATEGFQVLSDGRILSTVSGDQPLALNRLSSDGAIAEFYKDDTIVASIGSSNSGTDLVIDATRFSNRAGLRFRDSSLYPRQNATDADGLIDLGGPTAKFKNLYLSGGVQQSPVTVSNLPAAASSTGYRYMVSDSTVAASGNFGATVAGSGSNVVPVFSDGTNWLIG